MVTRDKIDVVLEWSSCPGFVPEDAESWLDLGLSSSGVRVELATDFNLALTTPSGEKYWMSTSFDDNTEIFEFCATEQGEYVIEAPDGPELRLP